MTVAPKPPCPTRAVARSAAALMAVIAVLAAVAAPAHADTKTPELTLAELVSRAMTSPRAQMAKQETRAAEARVSEARAQRAPKLELTSFIAPSPSITCDDPTCTRTTPTDISLALDGVFAGTKLSAVQPIYTFGKLSTITEAARAAARATALLENAATGDLAVEAARAYYGLKLARELRWMLEDGVAELDKAEERIKERLEEGSGEATVQDKLRLETLRAELVARLSEARQAEAVALAGVQLLAGDVAVDIDATPLDPVAMELGNAAQHVERARTGRPEVAAARAGAEAARAKHAFETAQYWPNLVVVGEVNIARAQGVDDPPSAFANDPFNITTAALGLALRWQIDPLAQRARVAQAAAKRDQAAALVTLADQAAGFDVERTHAEAREAYARVEASRAGETSARGWVASVLQADAVGTAESKDLADAMIAYFTVRARYLTSVYEWNLAVARLGRATGEFIVTPQRHEESK